VAEHIETTTTVTETTTEFPDPPDVEIVEVPTEPELSAEMTETIMERLNAMDLRLSDLAERTVKDEVTPEVPDEPVEDVPTDDPVVDEPAEDDDPGDVPDDGDGPTEDEPYKDRPEIEPNGSTESEPEKPKRKRTRERAPKQDLGWRGALLGGSGGMRGNRRGN
jgi:hypothetical protein